MTANQGRRRNQTLPSGATEQEAEKRKRVRMSFGTKLGTLRKTTKVKSANEEGASKNPV